MRSLLLVAIVIVAGAIGMLANPPAQHAGQTPPLAIASMSGKDLFDFYCAACHGRDGRGAGPVAAALATRPADLTAIARRNGGTFPRERVEAFVASDGGAPIAAHGTKDMPVWGPIFRALDPSDTRAAFRIENVVKYVESMQVLESGAASPAEICYRAAAGW
jgi:mono/diheme cytochrome c family protein